MIGLLMLPLVVTSRTFGHDWTLHLWMIRQQEMNIQANGRPGLFVSAKPLGVFYPIFAFVGSGLYTVGGYLALLLGDRPIVAYKLLYLGALCLAYGGTTWLSRQVGLRGWRSQIPGLVFVTGSYFVTDMFGRGDLGELAALAAIPFLIAAMSAATFSSRLNAGHLVAVVLAVFVLTGSHNLTLLWGTIFLSLLTLVLLGAYAPSRLARLPWRRLPAVLAAAGIGGGLNAWYLLPDLKYGLSTAVAKTSQKMPPLPGLSQWRLLVDPLRPSDSSYAPWSHDVRLSLPLLFAAWALVVAAIVWRRIDNVARRLIVLLSGLAGAYAWLLVSGTAWRKFPHVLYTVQFRWRLHSYVLLATVLLVMVVLVCQVRMKETARRATSALLVAIAVFTVGAATWQVWAVHSNYHTHARELTSPGNFADVVVASRHAVPPSWYAGGDFRDVNGRIVDIGSNSNRTVHVPEAGVRGSTYAGRLEVPAGRDPFHTNISAGPQFARMTGIKPIGITAAGYVMAVRAPGTPETGPVVVTIREASTTLLRRGALVSMLSLAALAILVAWHLIDRLGLWVARRRSGRKKSSRPKRMRAD